MLCGKKLNDDINLKKNSIHSKNKTKKKEEEVQFYWNSSNYTIGDYW